MVALQKAASWSDSLPVGSKYLVYPATWALSKAVGRGEHLLGMLALGTLLRYVVNYGFVAVSKIDSWTERIKVHRKNPPAHQLEREQDWDGPVILSPLAFVLVDLVTPFLRAERLAPLGAREIAWLFAAHYAAVEPVYYVFHRWLHGAWAYSRSHYHHHASTTTEAISGTSHPLHESVAYLANFSLAFLLPALYGRFAKELIPIYFVWFDIMNCAGHCNFECFPRWSQFGPLKWLCYTTSYHSLHHTKYKCNYALFCPLLDYLLGTVDSKSDSLHASVCGAVASAAPECVFLAHGFDFASMATHAPWASPYLAANECQQLTGLLGAVTWPFCFAWALVCRHCLSTAVVQRYHYKGTKCATWCLPVAAPFYMRVAERPAIARMVLAAVEKADDAGVKYVGLAALNKAEWLNRGGADVCASVRAQKRNVRVVHGNSLTAAAVLETVRRHATVESHAVVAISGATSKVGRALAVALATRGHAVLMLTSSQERFEDVQRAAGPHGGKLERIDSYAAGKRASLWLLGKLVYEHTLARTLAPGTLVVDIAVPHLVPSAHATYRYVNGAALRFDPKSSDLTFCHDLKGTVPACLAATIIHTRDDDLVGDEVGEVDPDSLDAWWQRAVKHGFDLLPQVLN